MVGTHFSHNKLLAVSLVLLLLSGIIFSGFFDGWNSNWFGSGSSSNDSDKDSSGGRAGTDSSGRSGTDSGTGGRSGSGSGSGSGSSSEIFIPPSGCQAGQIKVGGVCQFTALGSGAGSTLNSALNAGAGP